MRLTYNTLTSYQNTLFPNQIPFPKNNVYINLRHWIRSSENCYILNYQNSILPQEILDSKLPLSHLAIINSNVLIFCNYFILIFSNYLEAKLNLLNKVMNSIKKYVDFKICISAYIQLLHPLFLSFRSLFSIMPYLV